MPTIDDLLLIIPTPPSLALDWTPEKITPPEDYDYPEKWDRAMDKWTLFSGRFPAWRSYIEQVTEIAVEAKTIAVNAAVSVSLPIITPADYGKALRAGRENEGGMYTFQDYGEVNELRAELMLGIWDDEFF